MKNTSSALSWRLLAAVILAVVLCLPALPFAQTLKIMTYNLRYDNPNDGPDRWTLRREKLASLVRDFGPDVIGTQEGMHHQLVWLDSALAGFTFVGNGRDDGALKGEFSAVFYRKNAFEMLEQRTFWLSETPDQPSKGWDAALPRVCTTVRLKHKKSQRIFTLMNVHFDHIGVEARLQSAKQLVAYAQPYLQAGETVFLMGDFNATPASAPISEILKGFKDARSMARKVFEEQPGTFNGFDITKTAMERIDYVFIAGKSVAVKRYSVPARKIGGRYPSDHFPVFVECFIGE